MAGVEREIRVNDRNSSRQYLRNFTQAFRSYEQVISADDLHEAAAAADVVLIADYHALPAAQHFAADLLERRTHPGDRPVVLGVETIFSRDQHILDEWWRREIGERELRRRIRFDLDWGYDWEPFYQLLVTAREHGEAIYGLDCTPREDLRKIRARDRHAAHKIAEIRSLHPSAAIMILFGESHLAPAHLPRLVRQSLPDEKVVTVLQNVDALYWRAAGESSTHVEAVRVSEDVVCAFNTAPLEKYENYRLCLARWSRDSKKLDVTPTIYNLIEALVRSLGINRYSPHNGTQPKFLVDSMPEVNYAETSPGRFRARGFHVGRPHARVDSVGQFLARKIADRDEVDFFLGRLEERGSVYVPQLNLFYVREFRMAYAAEEAARFLHHACQGLGQDDGTAHLKAPENFFTTVLEDALGYFGSRLVCPQRPSASMPSACSVRILEQGFERALAEPTKAYLVARELGYAIGHHLYEQYLSGLVGAACIRKLFLAKLRRPEVAKQICVSIASQPR